VEGLTVQANIVESVIETEHGQIEYEELDLDSMD
jgi:hypothetical protein